MEQKKSELLLLRYPRLSVLFVCVDPVLRFSTDASGDYKRPEDVTLSQPMFTTLQTWKDRGWTIVGLSNLPGVREGWYDLATAREIERQTIRLATYLPVSIIASTTSEVRRKQEQLFDDLLSHNLSEDVGNVFQFPNPGLIFAGCQNIQRKFGAGHINLEDCLVLGGLPEHKALAANAKMPWMGATDFLEGRNTELSKRPQRRLKEMKEFKAALEAEGSPEAS